MTERRNRIRTKLIVTFILLVPVLVVASAMVWYRVATAHVRRETENRLLAVADRNLADAEVRAVSTDARVGFAHAATVALAATALAAEGYRAGKERHHERLLDSLRHTIDIDARLLKQLHDVRRARNALTYEQPGDTTQAEAEAIISRAGGVRVAVLEREAVAPVVERDAGSWDHDARPEALVVGLDVADHHAVGVGRVARELMPRLPGEPQHHLGVDEVLGAAERDHSDLHENDLRILDG